MGERNELGKPAPWSAKRYLAMASECKRRAANADKPEISKQWTGLADNWEALARFAALQPARRRGNL